MVLTIPGGAGFCPSTVAPEHRPCQNESRPPTNQFSGAMLVSGTVVVPNKGPVCGGGGCLVAVKCTFDPNFLRGWYNLTNGFFFAVYLYIYICVYMYIYIYMPG